MTTGLQKKNKGKRKMQKKLINFPQAGIKIVGRNINTLRYADDTTLMAASEEELKTSESERGE